MLPLPTAARAARATRAAAGAWLALAAGAACAPRATRPARPGAQVMAPVRIDLSSAGTGHGGTAAAVSDALARFAHRDEFVWPGPNRYRSASGAPGPDYWQQRADYQITAALDTANGGAVSGHVTIRYTNNSPDTLRVVWLHLDQNLFRPASKGAALFPADSPWAAAGFRGGFELADVTVNGRPAAPKVDDTVMRVDLDAPLPPRGGRASIAMRFSFRVPADGVGRMGRDGTLFQIAQWYPRMAVYDDVRGWNTEPYLGQGEFYLEYGDIDYAVTAPAGYVLAGSGTLQNPDDVLTPAQRQRLARAAAAGEAPVVAVVTRDEAEAARARPAAGTKTWRFRAESVRDVAWAAAPDLRWDATSWNGVLCHAYYQFPKAGRAWESAAEQTCWSIRTYSELVYPYPYPQATSVAGNVGGMEYPMLVFVHHGTNDPASIFETLDHEQGHQWFPMLVGTNERRYAWQDEGLDTYINAFSGERRYPGQDVWRGYVEDWRAARTLDVDAPLMTRPDHLDPRAVGPLAYRKPAVVLLALRNHVVGAETFDRAIREYARRWAFRHPTPGDFFRTVEHVSGAELSWFWRSFWYTTDVLDLGVEDVRNGPAKDGSGTVATVTVRRHSSVPFPIALRLQLADGSVRDVRFPVDAWARAGTDRFDAVVAVPREVVGVRLWPDPHVPDWNPANDTWGQPPPPTKVGPVTR